MNGTGPPNLDRRQSPDIAKDLLQRLPGYVPGWTPASAGPGQALIQIFARYLEILAQRLNLAPDKNKMALLDQLGLNLLPAQAARAPVVFQMAPEARDGRAPAATKLGAQVPGQDTPIIFETEQAIGVAGAKLMEVVTLWPGRDAYADHSAPALAGEPFTLFAPLQAVPHMLYLAHDVHFALTGQATVEIEFELDTPSNSPLETAWEYWDGKVWRGFKDFLPEDQDQESFDGTSGLTRSGVIRLAADCTTTAPTTVNGIESYWVRGRLLTLLPPQTGAEWPLVNRIRVRTVIDRSLPENTVCSDLPATAGFKPDLAFANGSKLDLSKAIYPLGQQPQPGSAFFFSSQEVFSKPGAQVTLCLSTVAPEAVDTTNTTALTAPVVAWEYWNSKQWTLLGSAPGGAAATFQATGSVSLIVPEDLAPTKVSGQEALWMRARLLSGGYGLKRTITWTDDKSNTTNKITAIETMPPALGDVRLGYLYRSPWDRPPHCLAYNDFQFTDHGDDLRVPGRAFAAFKPVADVMPALYLGFHKPLPVDQVSLYLDIQEEEGQAPGPVLVWEYWNGSGWQELALEDETANLRLPGMLAFIGPSDGIPLARFGTGRYWLRGRLRDDGDPAASQINGLYLNSVWASQVTTIQDESLGDSTGQPGQTFFCHNTPVLEGQVLEVRELTGARAEIGLPLVQQDLARQGMSLDQVRTVADPRTGKIQEVWVQWDERPNLLFSRPDDRHYVVERSRGRVSFGDGVYGKIPPIGASLVARTYKAGGGQSGNVPPGAITQLLGAVPFVQGVTNPRAGEGGADGEPAAAVLTRGPGMLRHLRQALSMEDYEALAREASPAVAVARALPATHPSGRPAPGWVKLIIMPHSLSPQPWPSFELRRQVQSFLAARAPAAVAGQITVTGPDYLAVGVQAVIAPVNPQAAGPVDQNVRLALANFLHPLTGGPEGTGWPFGRNVYLSDLAALLERVTGVDYVAELILLLEGTPQGDFIPVPPDRIVVAGELRLRVEAAAGS
jgi:hypothetical protein